MEFRTFLRLYHWVWYKGEFKEKQITLLIYWKSLTDLITFVFTPTVNVHDKVYTIGMVYIVVSRNLDYT